MSESYAGPWTSATIHVNLATGEMHSDGDHLVRQWIEETISLYKKENAELLAANAADESPQLIAGLESLVDELEKSNAELLAAAKVAVAEFDTGWFAQGKSILVAAIENMEGK